MLNLSKEAASNRMNDFSKHQTIVVVTAEWDEEASVWVATSEDEKIGLVTEAPTLDELKDRVVAVLPELIQGQLQDFDTAPVLMNLSAKFDLSLKGVKSD